MQKSTGWREYERQHAKREFRHGVNRDGMVWGRFLLPPDTGASVVNRIEREADRCYRAADRDRRHHEPHRCFAADALVGVVTGAAAPARTGGGADFVIHVSYDALRRGSTEGDEICLVEGVGGIPVEVARRHLDDAFLKGVLVDGTDVRKVKHLGRRIPAAVRTALEVHAVLEHSAVQLLRCPAVTAAPASSGTTSNRTRTAGQLSSPTCSHSVGTTTGRRLRAGCHSRRDAPGAVGREARRTLSPAARVRRRGRCG